MLRRFPDIANIKQRMHFASSGDSLKLALHGITAQVHASDPDDIAYETGAYGLCLRCTTREERSDAIVSSA